MKLKNKLYIVLMMFLITGCSTNNKNIGSELTTVKAYEVNSKLVEDKATYTGYVTADEQKNYSFELSGKIKEIFVEKGDKITTGQILATLDEITIQNAVDNAEAVIKQAQSTITQAESSISDALIGIEQSQNVIEEAEIGIEAQKQALKKLETSIETEELAIKKTKDSYSSALTKLQLNYDDSYKTYNDMNMLYNNGVISKSDYDKAKLAFDTVSEELKNQKTSMENDIKLEESKLNGLKEDYKLQQIQIKNSEAKITQAETSKKSAETKLEQAKTQKKAAEIQLEQAEISLKQTTDNLDKCTIKSSIDGYVVEIPLKSGEVTNAGTPVVFVKNETEIINVSIPVEDYSKFAVGMTVQLNQDKINMEGSIISIDSYPDETTRTYNMQIIPSRQKEFVIGGIVTVEINTDMFKAVTIPLSSIFDVDGLNYVYCIKKDEKDDYIVMSKQVELGVLNGEEVVATGLSDKELIVANEVKYLNNNQTVQISKEE